jgi:hypothetical protein
MVTVSVIFEMIVSRHVREETITTYLTTASKEMRSRAAKTAGISTTLSDAEILG